jgi:hypothetical protein
MVGCMAGMSKSWCAGTSRPNKPTPLRKEHGRCQEPIPGRFVGRAMA